jgi:hypothetical protein
MHHRIMTSRFFSAILTLIVFLPSFLAAEDEKSLVRKSAIFAKLQLKIPNLGFENTTVAEGIEFLRLRSLELDPEKEGVNFVIRQNNEGPQLADAIIGKLEARDITFVEALSAICLKTKSSFQIDEFAITLVPHESGASDEEASQVAMVQRSWETPPGFLDYLTPKSAQLQAIPVKDLLQVVGVTFPEGSVASHLSSSNVLIVRNTPVNLHLIDGVVKASFDPEKALRERREIEQIVIPLISLNNSSLEEAIEFLRLRSLELDPDKKGVNIHILGDEELSGTIVNNLSLRNIPIFAGLKYICDLTETSLFIQGRNIVIFPKKK